MDEPTKTLVQAVIQRLISRKLWVQVMHWILGAILVKLGLEYPQYQGLFETALAALGISGVGYHAAQAYIDGKTPNAH